MRTQLLIEADFIDVDVQACFENVYIAGLDGAGPSEIIVGTKAPTDREITYKGPFFYLPLYLLLT